MTPELESEELSSVRFSTQTAKKPDAQSGGSTDFFPGDDFALLQDKAECWMTRLSAVSTLEACGKDTCVHLSTATLLVRRLLRECEGKLDPSLFFHARRDCIVNLAHVSQIRTLVPFQLVFVLQDRREIVASREHSLLFRRSRAL